MEKRLYLSNTNKVLAGVCGGLGEYFGLDPVLIRIIAVILAFTTGIGVLGYIVCWIVMPRRPEGVPVDSDYEYSSWHKYLPGLLLILLGAIFIIRENWYWFYFDEIWPILLILAGVAVILVHWNKREVSSFTASQNNSSGGPTVNGHGNGGSV